VQALSKLTANKLLQDKVVNHARMSVLLDTSVTSFNANESGKLESITVSCDGTESIHETAGAFIFIVSIPIRVSSRTRWTLTRVDLSSPTQIFARASTEFFAAGDVRSGFDQTDRVGVGEGAAVAIQIRYYLDSLDRVDVNS